MKEKKWLSIIMLSLIVLQILTKYVSRGWEAIGGENSVVIAFNGLVRLQSKVAFSFLQSNSVICSSQEDMPLPKSSNNKQNLCWQKFDQYMKRVDEYYKSGKTEYQEGLI